MTKQQLLALQKQLAQLDKQRVACDKILRDAGQGNAKAVAKRPDAEAALEAINANLDRIQQQLRQRLEPVAQEYQDVEAIFHDAGSGRDIDVPKEAPGDKLFLTKKFRDNRAQVEQSIDRKHPHGNAAQHLKNLFVRALLEQTITRLTETRDALRREAGSISFELGAAPRANMRQRAEHLGHQITRLRGRLHRTANPLAVAPNAELSDAQRQLQQEFQAMNLGDQAKTLSAEFAHAQLLCAPAAAIDGQPNTTYGALQAAAFASLGDINPDDDLNPKLRATQQVVNTLTERAPWDGSTQTNYMEGSKKAAKTSSLLAAVPSFDRLTDTHPGQKGITLDHGIAAALADLETMLGQIRGLAAQADELSNQLRDPSIDAATKSELIKKYGNLYEQLQQKGSDFNEFLYDHANTFNPKFSGRNHGYSELSVITQDKLNELARFNDELIDKMKSELTTAISLTPFKGSGTIYDWPVTLARALQPRNRKAMTRAGGSDSWRRHLLESNPGFTDFYGEETRSETYEKHGPFGIFQRNTKSELNNCTLPIHRPKLPTNATPKQIEESKGLSLLAAAKEAFGGDNGSRWQEHVYFKNGGRDVRITWKNAKERDAFTKAVKSREAKYTKLMDEIKNPQIQATQQQGPQQGPGLRAAWQEQQREAAPVKPTAPPADANELPAAPIPVA